MQADFHIYGHIYADIPGAYMWSFKSMWYNHIYVYMYVSHICSDNIALLMGAYMQYGCVVSLTIYAHTYIGCAIT